MRVPITKKPAPARPPVKTTPKVEPKVAKQNPQAAPGGYGYRGADARKPANPMPSWTEYGKTYQTGDNERKTVFSPTGTKIRMGPNTSFTPSIPKPPKRNILQDLMILLKGGQLTPQAPSNVLGVRG